jgi:hypothetical protein
MLYILKWSELENAVTFAQCSKTLNVGGLVERGLPVKVSVSPSQIIGKDKNQVLRRLSPTCGKIEEKRRSWNCFINIKFYFFLGLPLAFPTDFSP